MAGSTTTALMDASGTLAAALKQARRPDDPGWGRSPTEPLKDKLSQLKGAAHGKLAEGWTWRELTLWVRNPTGPDGAPLRDANGAPIPGIPASQSTVRRAIGTPPPRERNGNPTGTGRSRPRTPEEPRASHMDPHPASDPGLHELIKEFGVDSPDRPLNPATRTAKP